MRSRDPGAWIWAEAMELLQSTERLQRRMFVVGTMRTLPSWEPAVDLYEQEDELHLLVALPGVSARHLEVLVEGGAIVVRGQRPIPNGLRRAEIHRLEIPYGHFERRITLPPGNFGLAKQLLEDGCLALVLRRV